MRLVEDMVTAHAAYWGVRGNAAEQTRVERLLRRLGLRLEWERTGLTPRGRRIHDALVGAHCEVIGGQYYERGAR